jgi:hypothetical protein
MASLCHDIEQLRLNHEQGHSRRQLKLDCSKDNPSQIVADKVGKPKIAVTEGVMQRVAADGYNTAR